MLQETTGTPTHSTHFASEEPLWCRKQRATGHINQKLRLNIHTGPSATGARTHTPMHIGCECASPSCVAHCHNLGPEMGVAAAQIIVDIPVDGNALDIPVDGNAPPTSGWQRPGRVKCAVEGVAETESAPVAPNCLCIPSRPLAMAKSSFCPCQCDC